MGKKNKKIDEIDTINENKETEDLFGKAEKSQKKNKLFQVRFKENRTHECYVGLEILVWGPRGMNPTFPEKYTRGLPKEILEHKDFETQKKYFVITEGE